VRFRGCTGRDRTLTCWWESVIDGAWAGSCWDRSHNCGAMPGIAEPCPADATRRPTGAGTHRTVALSRGRFERVDEQGRAQQRLFPDDEQGMRRKKDARWPADCKGFSLHAGVSFGALDRKGRERLVRYCTLCRRWRPSS